MRAPHAATSTVPVRPAQPSRQRFPRGGWLPVAAVLMGAGWGSNQFTPMLLVYSHMLALGTGTLEAMFGVYALGLVPGLLLAGPLSDVRGRRVIVIPAAALSLAASLILVAAGHSAASLFVGRLLAGLSNGAVFSAGTAWVRELSRHPGEPASEHRAARRAAVAMTLGFALGPLVAGVLAQWAPLPGSVPYLPHVALMAVTLGWLARAPETLTRRPGSGIPLGSAGVAAPRFRRVVAPMAPWVFAAPAIAFGLLPSIAGAGRAAGGIALTAAVTAVCALAGVLIQPLARRLDARAGANRAGVTGLLVVCGGLLLAAFTAGSQQTWLLIPTSVVFGSAYGLCLVAGLVEVQRIAGEGALAGLTAVFYTLTYAGFAAPYLLALAAHLASYSVLLLIAAVLALGTTAAVARARS